MSAAAARIGTDIGGTFTDVAAVDRHGVLRVGKRLTTHGAEHEAVVAAVADTDVELGEAGTILAHGTTLVINALLERSGVRVGFVTTRGFADVIEIGRANRPESFNVFYRRDPPLVPPDLRFEIEERIHANGEVVRRPTDEDLGTLAAQLREARVDAVAIGLMNAYVEQSNERCVGEYLRQALPGIPVSISSDLSRQWREYERFTTATANAYVAPIAERYLERILQGLGKDGYRGEFLVLDSAGGALSVDTARRFPVRTTESGPVAGVLGARRLAESLGIDRLVTFDMGGTTAKCSVVRAGQVASTDMYWIGGYDRGFPLQVHCVDITEVGSGGGSIAWTDASGRLLVGPRSAGSQPGPACYGLGGSEPTVTDANLYCGRIPAERFAESLSLNRDAAAAALERLAGELGMDDHRLALGIIKLANLSMANAVRRQTLERGLDPREFVLVACGGAGPMHACEVAAEVGMRRVVVPRFPGHFSAIGMLSADLQLERREIFRGPLAEVEPQAVRSALARIADELVRELDAPGVSGAAGAELRYALSLRYRGQDHSLLIPAPTDGLDVPADFAQRFRDSFEDEYVRRYGHLNTAAGLECVELEVVAVRPLEPAPIDRAPTTHGPRSTSEAYFGLGAEAVTADVVPRGELAIGDRFAGPLVIYEVGATTVVPPGVTARVTGDGALDLDVSGLLR